MKTRWVLSLILIAILPLTSSALVVSRSYSNTTSDDDNSSLEDANSSQGTIGSVSANITTVGSSSGNMGYRFTGQAAAGDGGALVQDIAVSVTWTVTAEEWEEYSIVFSPEFHSLMIIEDGGLFQESGDGIWFSALSATLNLNGNKIFTGSADLGLSGGSIEDRADSGTTLDSTSTWTRGGYTGNNTFELIYSGTLTVTSKSGSGGNDTYLAGLWGQDGALGSIGGSDGTFDNYSSSLVRNADGFFVDANVTLNSVPEPASALMLAVGAGLLGICRRYYR